MLNQRHLLKCLPACLMILAGCATTVGLNIQSYTAPGTLNPVTYYAGYKEAPNLEKVVLFIRGTGRFPASQDIGMGAEATLLGYAVVYPQKSYVDDEAAYYRHDYRGQRLHDLVAICDHLISHGTQRILLLADSEGTMLAPEIAARYPQIVCGLVCMGGSVFNFEQDIRYAAANKRGLFGQTPGIDAEDALQRIALDPENTAADFLGHSYKFWSSYLQYDPLPDLKRLACPILYINGGDDDLDMPAQQQRLAGLAEGGLKIESKVYPGCGHELKSVGKTMLRDILAWTKRSGLDK